MSRSTLAPSHSQPLRMIKQAHRIYIGTSGWDYPQWRSLFYPEEVSQEHWLTYYSKRFRTLEINNSFYHLPKSRTLQRWRLLVPDGFRFALKASRYITHNKNLNDSDKPVARLLERAAALGDALGPILFQLPPHWRCNIDRLIQFLQALPQGFDYCIECRNPTWHCPEVYDILSHYGVAFCIFDLQQTVSPKPITADFIYIRLHGPQIEPYTGSYSTQTLAGWTGALSTWSSQGKSIYCYFNNDQEGHAPQNALHLKSMVDG